MGSINFVFKEEINTAQEMQTSGSRGPGPAVAEWCAEGKEGEEGAPGRGRRRRSVHIAPVRSGFEVHDQRDAKGVDVFHGVAHERAKAIQLGGRGFKKKLVVYLEDHARAELLGGEFAVNMDHGELDEIGGG